MPKAIHVTSVHRLHDNRIFHKQCASLRDNGWEVVLVAQHDRDESISGIRVRALPRPANRMERMTKLPELALGICREEGADICHLHDPELLKIAALLKRDVSPVVFDMHENIVKDILTKPWLPALLRPAVSAYVRQRLRRWLSGMPVIFAELSYHADYPYVDTYTTVLNMPRHAELSGIRAEKHLRPTLVYVGGVTRARGSVTMLEALARLQAAGLDCALELVGPVEERHRQELDELISSRGIANVRFHGFLPAGEAWPVAARCHVGMALLSSIPNYVESYPSKIFEYMALGLPVVTSDFELYRSVIAESAAGICVDPEDATAVAETLAALLADGERMEEMSAAGRAITGSRFNWETEERRLLDFYARQLG
ncbi:MAG: glycosyltransferase [bacterium]